jgi:hypothetical protein
VRDCTVTSFATGKEWSNYNFVNVEIRDLFRGIYPGMLEDIPEPLEADFRQLRAVARSRFTSAIRQKRTEFSGPTFLGEMRETIQFIRKPAVRIIKEIDEYLLLAARARRTINRGLSFTRWVAKWESILANLWLELSFGVKPLLADMRDLGHALGRMYEPRCSDVVRGQHNETKLIHLSNSPSLVSPAMQVRVNWTIERKLGCTVYGRLKADAEVPQSMSRITDLLGFRFENFFPTVYELVPFSWLVDYYTNLGKLLESACTDTSGVAWSNEVLWLRDKMKIWAKLEPRPFAETGLSVFRLGDDTWGEAEKTLNWVYRDVSKTLIPPLTFSLPGLPGQLLNQLAVTLQGAKALGRPPRLRD